MRELLVTGLVKELLGPRNGLHELIESEPKDEYITGVLRPGGVRTVEIPHSALEMPAIMDFHADAEDEDAGIETEVPLSPSIDPKSLPRSFGLSFRLRAEDAVCQFRLCAHWARYERRKQGWQRLPRVYVSDIITINTDGTEEQRILLSSQGSEVDDHRQAEVTLTIRAKKNGDTIHVSLFFSNSMELEKGQYADSELYIFQPQLRVICEGKTCLSSKKGEVDTVEEFLYREKPVLAKGHLCSAVWKEIDPLRDTEQLSYDEIPFNWLEAPLVEQRYGAKIMQTFRLPDVRTEFIPAYSVQAPLFKWSGDEEPELDPEKLAEAWDPSLMRRYLQPFQSEYSNWISGLRDRAAKLPESDRKMASRVVDRCIITLKRIEKGIEILCNDDEVRLAFCFANKAIVTQAEWVGIKQFRWRPFQMAFALNVLESIANPDSSEREVCDLLWVPTGGGKTEAYLLLLAFTLAYRRRRGQTSDGEESTGEGVAVITRYTLRLLAIQQFRRALRLITACEFLRVKQSHGAVGWRPAAYESGRDLLWGSSRFSAGLWVGGGVTPNALEDRFFKNGRRIPGALSLLRDPEGHSNDSGEPAQVLNCPACNTILSIPKNGLDAGKHILHLVVEASGMGVVHQFASYVEGSTIKGIRVEETSVKAHSSTGFFTITISLTSKSLLLPGELQKWWEQLTQDSSIDLVSTSVARPGYFFRKYITPRSKSLINYDFEIFCPNPVCPLHGAWFEGAPLGWVNYSGAQPLAPDNVTIDGRSVSIRDGNRACYVGKPFRLNGYAYVADRVPIPAYTVDAQVYSRCPSVVVSTVDKFARLPYEPRSSALFGNVNRYHCLHGYYRPFCAPTVNVAENGHPRPLHPSGPGSRSVDNYIKVSELRPPELILQDELHLIDGPIGSMVGLYETAVDFLCTHYNQSVKYIASTATVNRAEEQVVSVFARSLQVFPPAGLSEQDSFFVRFEHRHPHPLDDARPGRLYLGVCAPGRGPLTPIIRIWARLLQGVRELADQHGKQIDDYWTLTGYFNAIRELAGARAVYWQDVRERIGTIRSRVVSRDTDESRVYELSSRIDSTSLPGLLQLLNREFAGNPGQPDCADVLFATSMFGTGIDIPRLGLMVVHGQPKTTSAYIQSSGRVGRKRGGLVVTFYRATRPRDLSHYEIFGGYHQSLNRFVEPVSVAPFASGTLEKALGPVAVGILRNMRGAKYDWYRDNVAHLMAVHRTHAPELVGLENLFTERARRQPSTRRPDLQNTQFFVRSQLDRWEKMAQLHNDLCYVEYGKATRGVVLGDPQHQYAGKPVVYENSPQSLRNVEETTGFQIRDKA